MIQHKIVVTSAYKLKCKHILHIDAMFYSKYNDWEKAYTSALQEAERLGFHSLAVPALGTGTSFFFIFSFPIFPSIHMAISPITNVQLLYIYIAFLLFYRKSWVTRLLLLSWKNIFLALLALFNKSEIYQRCLLNNVVNGQCHRAKVAISSTLLWVLCIFVFLRSLSTVAIWVGTSSGQRTVRSKTNPEDTSVCDSGCGWQCHDEDVHGCSGTRKARRCCWKIKHVWQRWAREKATFPCHRCS